MHTTPYQELLPPNSMFFAHPFAFLGRYIEVYRMHVDYVSTQTGEMRKQKVEDAKKRAEFRRAHGLEQSEDEKYRGSFAARWFGQGEEKPPEVRRDDDGGNTEALAVAVVEPAISAPMANTMGEAGNREGVLITAEGTELPAKKKWLGVW